MIRKILLLAGVLIALMAAPAIGQYSPTLAAPGTVAPGQPFTVSGEGANPGATINVYLTGPITATNQAFSRTPRVGRAGPTSSAILVGFTASTASASTVLVGSTTSRTDGTFAAEITLPATTPTGTYTLTARGGGIVRATTIQVQGLSATPTTAAGTGTGPGNGSTGTGNGSTGTGARTGTGTGSGNGSTGTGSGTVNGSTGTGNGSTGTGVSALPRTGSNNMQPLTIGGAVLVAIGGLLVLATRRRRHRSPVTV